MSEVSTAPAPAPTPAELGIAFHHIGIQTADLDNCLSWYRAFFGATQNWSLDRFSDLTRSRLPGIVRLVEVAVGGLRFHVFERDGEGTRTPPAGGLQFQHVCISVSSREEVEAWQARYAELYRSGDYKFEVPEEATYVDVDKDGVASFYCYDPNGLEFEFTYVPAGLA